MSIFFVGMRLILRIFDFFSILKLEKGRSFNICGTSKTLPYENQLQLQTEMPPSRFMPEELKYTETVLDLTCSSYVLMVLFPLFVGISVLIRRFLKAQRFIPKMRTGYRRKVV